MKRIIATILTLALLLSASSALALTGEEALGLTGGGSSADAAAAAAASGSKYPVLQRGAKDADDATPYVTMLQTRLQELGYLAGSADGAYGGLTESAVIAFQENNGLTETGIADNETQIVVFSNSAQRATADSSKVNPDVLTTQTKLILWGFLTGSADGVSGQATQTAVSEFKQYIYVDCAASYAAIATPEPAPVATPAPADVQPVAMDEPASAVHLDFENGFDGEITDNVLNFTTDVYPFQLFQKTVQSGDTGAEVWRVQRRLHQLGYLYKPDGSFGALTQYALKNFQKLNGLEETGAADQTTQEALFSNGSIKAEEYVFPYKVGVDISEQRVYVLAWDGSGYSKEVHKFKCSTGVDASPTPLGTFQSGGKVTAGMWYYFTDYNCYAKYAYRIIGGIMFHSVLYSGAKKGPTRSSVNALGRKASHGCIRMAEDDAKWIFENCPEGTTIVIRE